MIEINCEQGSEEWHLARVGVTTASMFRIAVEETSTLNEQQAKYVEAIRGGADEATAQAMAGYKAPPRSTSIADALAGKPTSYPSAGSVAYCDEIAMERISEEPYGDTYQTYAMKRGSEMEKWARIRYEELYNCEVTESGILLTDDRKFGYSTDGRREDGKGLLEIKTPESLAKIRNIIETNDISEYMHQIQGGLWLTALEFCDLVMYVPPLSRIGNDIYVHRVYRDEDFIEKLETGLLAFESRVQTAEAFWRRTFRRDGLDAAPAPSPATLTAADIQKAVAVASKPRAMRSSLASLLSA